MATSRPMLDGLFTPGESGFEETGGLVTGLEFEILTLDDPLWLTAIRWYQPSGGTVETTDRIANLYRYSDTSFVASNTTDAPTGSGWQVITLAEPYEFESTGRYKAIVVHTTGGYPATSGFFTGGGPMASNYDDGPVRVFNDANSTDGQCTFGGGNSMALPISTSGSSNYWLDVSVTDDLEEDPDAPVPGRWSTSLTFG